MSAVARMPEPIPTCGDVGLDALLAEIQRATPKKRDLALRQLRYRIEGLLVERHDALEAVRLGPGEVTLSAVREEREAQERLARTAEDRDKAEEAIYAKLVELYPELGMPKTRYYGGANHPAAELAETLADHGFDAYSLPRGLRDVLSCIEDKAVRDTDATVRAEIEKDQEVDRERADAADAHAEALERPAREVAGALLAVIGMSYRDGDSPAMMEVRDCADRILRMLPNGECAVDEWRGIWRDAR